MRSSAAFEAWSAKARAVKIEDEIARRGIKCADHRALRPVPEMRRRRSLRHQCRQAGLPNCRGCDVGGDVIKLVEHLDGLDFIAACTALTGEPPPKGNG